MQKIEFVMMYGMFLLIVSNLASYYGQEGSIAGSLDDFAPPTLPDTSGWGVLGVVAPVVWVVQNLAWFLLFTTFSMSIFPFNILFIVLNIGMVWALMEIVRGV